MHGSGSGPLGALLLIVPLAAIPVFAIVGVPQFAPLSASPSDEDDLVADLGDADALRSSASVETPHTGRSADDLFAPLAESPSRLEASATPQPAPRAQPDSNSSSGGSPKLPPLPPSEALDQWEIRQDAPEAIARQGGNRRPLEADASRADTEPSETLQLPTDDVAGGKVSARGFSPDLLRLEATGQPGAEAQLAPRGLSPPSPPGNRALARGDREPSPTPDLSHPTAAQPATLAEQSGWQAAARHLKELGVSKYRLESQIEKQTFVFSCAIPSPDNPRIARRFEADADNPLEAVQIVLEQIDEWRNRDNRAKIAALPAEDDQ